MRKISPAGAVTTLPGLPGGSLGMTIDSSGNLLWAETASHTIRKLTPGGVVSTVAGLSGNPGSEDGPVSTARFRSPSDVAVDSAGNLYVTELFNHTVRKITPGGQVSTLAGAAGVIGSTDGPGSVARFNMPWGIGIDSGGTLYVSDWMNKTVRKVTPDGTVTTLAGTAGAFGSNDGTGSAARFGGPHGLSVDSAGNVFVAEENNNNIRKITPTGVTTTIAGAPFVIGSADGSGSAAQFAHPADLAVDNSGNIYVSDTENHTIRVGSLLPVITSPLGAIAVKNEKFVYQFEAFQATSLAASNLPPGLAFDTARSAILGNATTTGVFPVTLSASNAAGTTTAILTLVVQDNPPSVPVIISSTSITGRTQEFFKFQVVTLGTTPAAQLTVTDCPCGLSADPLSGVISGTPTADGSSKVNLTVTDVSATATGAVQLTFTSDPVRPVITSPDRANLVPGEAFKYQIVAPTSDPPTFSILGNSSTGTNIQCFDGGHFGRLYRHVENRSARSAAGSGSNLPVAFSERFSFSPPILAEHPPSSSFFW